MLKVSEVLITPNMCWNLSMQKYQGITGLKVPLPFQELQLRHATSSSSSSRYSSTLSKPVPLSRNPAGLFKAPSQAQWDWRGIFKWNQWAWEPLVLGRRLSVRLTAKKPMQALGGPCWTGRMFSGSPWPCASTGRFYLLFAALQLKAKTQFTSSLALWLRAFLGLEQISFHRRGNLLFTLVLSIKSTGIILNQTICGLIC